MRVEPRYIGIFRSPVAITYAYHDHQLSRRVIDIATQQFHEDVLLTGITALTAAYFVDYQLRWEPVWQVGDSLDRATPSAIQLTFVIQGRTVTHIFALPSV